jgi:hypothetical protein
MRPMLKALPTCPMRFKVRVSPITTKPARVKMFMPKRISLVSTALALGQERWLGKNPIDASITIIRLWGVLAHRDRCGVTGARQDATVARI